MADAPHRFLALGRPYLWTIFKILGILAICTILLSWTWLPSPKPPAPVFIDTTHYQEAVLPNDLEARTYQRFDDLLEQGKLFFEETRPRSFRDVNGSNFRFVFRIAPQLLDALPLSPILPLPKNSTDEPQLIPERELRFDTSFLDQDPEYVIDEFDGTHRLILSRTTLYRPSLILATVKKATDPDTELAPDVSKLPTSDTPPSEPAPSDLPSSENPPSEAPPSADVPSQEAPTLESPPSDNPPSNPPTSDAPTDPPANPPPSDAPTDPPANPPSGGVTEEVPAAAPPANPPADANPPESPPTDTPPADLPELSIPPSELPPVNNSPPSPPSADLPVENPPPALPPASDAPPANPPAADAPPADLPDSSLPPAEPALPDNPPADLLPPPDLTVAEDASNPPAAAPDADASTNPPVVRQSAKFRRQQETAPEVDVPSTDLNATETNLTVAAPPAVIRPPSNDDDLTPIDLGLAWSLIRAFKDSKLIVTYDCGINAGAFTSASPLLERAGLSVPGIKYLEAFPSPDSAMGYRLWPALAPPAVDPRDPPEKKPVAWAIPDVPFEHLVLRYHPTATLAVIVRTHRRLLALLRRMQDEAEVMSPDYNVIITSEWMAMVPRRRRAPLSRTGVKAEGENGPWRASAQEMLGLVSVRDELERERWHDLGYGEYLKLLGIPRDGY